MHATKKSNENKGNTNGDQNINNATKNKMHRKQFSSMIENLKDNLHLSS